MGHSNSPDLPRLAFYVYVYGSIARSAYKANEWRLHPYRAALQAVLASSEPSVLTQVLLQSAGACHGMFWVVV